MKHHLITIAFLIAAALCYAAGFARGILIFAVAGLVLECIFWLRLFKRRRGAA